MPAPAIDPPAPPARPAVFLGAAALGLAALAAYSNTLSVPFLFDDTPSILDNPSIWHLGRLRDVLSPSGGYGITVSGRPLLNLSLALCYAVSGKTVWSYHALNLLIHILAGLTLFGVVRRTLIGFAIRDTGYRIVGTGSGKQCGQRSQVTGHKSVAEEHNDLGPSTLDLRPRLLPLAPSQTLGLAFAVALLWTLHPLQTEAVTYIIQRTESLMGLFFLLTFYGFIRSVGSPSPRRWQWLTVGSCLLGMATKEVTAVAPLLVLLYDRTFVAGSFREAWRRRRWLHLGLAATWLPLALLVSGTGWNRGGTAGFNVGISPWAYWFTQFPAVVQYLKQAVWPHPLVFEYGTFWMSARDAAPYALVVLPLAGATLVALWRWPVWGFLGAWFFAILAPTSLVPGTIQMIVEHRMYLPLAAVIAAGAGLAASRLGRPALALLLALAVGFGILTARRNADYRDDLTLWQVTVARSPESAIAQSSLGTANFLRGNLREAMQRYRVSLSLDPKYPMVHYNLGLAYGAMGHPTQAVSEFREAIRINPRFYPAHFELGLIRLALNQPQDAWPHFEQVVRLMPSMPEAHFEWGLALFTLGRAAEAIPHYREALRLRPGYVEAECALGTALDQTGHVAEAADCFRRALRLSPKFADAHFKLGLTLARSGAADQARAEYAEAVRLDPRHVPAQLNLGIALAQSDQLPEALEHLEQAVQLNPGFADAHCNLGIVLAQVGRPDEAVTQYQEALRLRPDYALAHYNLGNALITLRRLPEARSQFEEAVRLDPQLEAARDMLERLRSFSGPP